MRHMSYTMTVSLFWFSIVALLFIMYASYQLAKAAKASINDLCTERHGTRTISHSVSGDAPISRYNNKYPFVTSICAKKENED